jgi:hypothetical protein
VLRLTTGLHEFNLSESLRTQGMCVLGWRDEHVVQLVRSMRGYWPSSTTRRRRTAQCSPGPPTAPDKAAICVWFDGLPQEADRFVLVAAVDPQVNPNADLSGFTDPCVRLRDPELAELGQLDVSDGAPRETLACREPGRADAQESVNAA